MISTESHFGTAAFRSLYLYYKLLFSLSWLRNQHLFKRELRISSPLSVNLLTHNKEILQDREKTNKI